MCLKVKEEREESRFSSLHLNFQRVCTVYVITIDVKTHKTLHNFVRKTYIMILDQVNTVFKKSLHSNDYAISSESMTIFSLFPTDFHYTHEGCG